MPGLQLMALFALKKLERLRELYLAFNFGDDEDLFHDSTYEAETSTSN